MERADRHCPPKLRTSRRLPTPKGVVRVSGKGTRRRPSRLAPRARTYTSFNSAALMDRTRTFHSAGVSRTMLSASPMRTAFSSISTVGHASHLGHRETVFVMSSPPCGVVGLRSRSDVHALLVQRFEDWA